MKKFTMIFLSINIIIFLSHACLFPSDDTTLKLKAFINDEIFSSNADNDWIASVNGVHIEKKDFEDSYQYFLSQIPSDQKSKMPGETDMKKIYLNNMIYQDVVVMQALSDGKIWTDRFDSVLKRMLFQAVYQLYLSEILPKSGFAPTESEINEFYKNNSNALSFYDSQTKREYAVKTLSEQKIKQWIFNRVESYKSNYIITNRMD